jgi:hypothetical protein
LSDAVSRTVQWLGAILLPLALAGEDTMTFLGLEEPYALAKPDGTPSMTFFKINERQYLELFPDSRLIEPKVGVNRKRQANLCDPDGTRTGRWQTNPAFNGSATPVIYSEFVGQVGNQVANLRRIGNPPVRALTSPFRQDAKARCRIARADYQSAAG